MDLEVALKQLRNLPCYKDKPDALMQAALKKVRMGDRDLDVSTLFNENKEKKKAKDLLKKYIDDYVIETISDKNTLKQLVYLEIIQLRLQDVANKAHNENKAVPLKYLDSLHKNSSQIITLKETLGITHDKSSKEDSYSSLNEVKKKFAIWRKENSAERTRLCPHCGEMIYLIMRTDAYDIKKHPFFKGRFLTNKVLLKLYKANRITKKEFAEALEVSEDYIDFLLDKIDRKYDTSDHV